METPLIAFRLLVAAAWSDGQLHPAEELVLGRYLQRLPVSDAEKSKLIDYLTLQPASDTSHLWIEQFKASHATDPERKELLRGLKLLMAADGRMAEEETQLLAEFKEALKDHHDTPALLSQVKSWFKSVSGS
jgi:uncharacterized tellurite resistance protein B-like protein